MVEAALFDAIADAPDDDERRLVFADAVSRSQPERGELIALQCALARGSLARAEAIAAHRRVAELLAAHGERWAGLAGIARRYEFVRGFVERVEIEAADLVSHGDTLLARAPALRRIDLVGLVADLTNPRVEPGTSEQAGAVMAMVARVLATRAVRATPCLGFARVGVLAPRGFVDLFPVIVERMRNTEVLYALRGLAVPLLDRATLHRLVFDPRIGGLEALELTAGCLDLRLGDYESTPLAPARLHLGPEPVAFEQLGGLARNATDLGPVSNLAHVQAPQRVRLRALRVAWHQKAARRELSRDAAFAGLVELAITRDRKIGAEALAPLLHARDVRPRVLALDAPLSADAIRVIAAAPLGSVVEVLDLRGRHARANRDVDASAFDGIVLR